MQSKSSTEIRQRLGRLPLLALGMASLVTGVWGGLLRLPMSLPLPTEHANWITFHGPLMVGGFLGTVIGLERAVGLRSLWTYLAPLLTGAGAVILMAGGLGPEGPVLLTVGSAIFAAVSLRVVQLHRALFTSVMSVGALLWVTGNVLWLAGWSVHRVVPWWMAFLALTIIGERLDLSRFQRPSPWAQPLLLTALGFFLTGVVLSALLQTAGERIAGVGLVALGLWLGQFDIARRTVKQTGLTRFMAVCLLSGYVWLAAAGVLVMAFSPLETGYRYDAALHAFFLGFVFAMIFGHAPVIFPSVLNLPVAYGPRFYLHLAVLHAALLLRVIGDLADWVAGRQWGATLNALALALFLLNTVSAMLLATRATPPLRRA